MGRRNASGFTLIEILVVVAIIALLIGVLVPVVRHAQISAKETAVKAQMQNLSSGLEMFHGDFGYYPSSLPQDADGINVVTPAHTGDGTTNVVQGYHRLAFALVGRDKLGCPARRGNTGTTYDLPNAASDPGPDSLTGWYYSTAKAGEGGIGSFNGTWVAYSTTKWIADNRTARKAPYINPEGFSVVNDDIAGSYVPVICDKFDVRKGEKITSANGGYTNRSMFLYFTANPQGLRIGYNGTETSVSNWDQQIYYAGDNQSLMPTLSGGGIDQVTFWNTIEDPNAKVVNDRMPHNKDGFILLSPGPDLKYLTKDDLVNWTQ